MFFQSRSDGNRWHVGMHFIDLRVVDRPAFLLHRRQIELHLVFALTLD